MGQSRVAKLPGLPHLAASESQMNREWDDPEESRRFLETTNEVEMSDDPKDFDRALKKVAPHREKYTLSRKLHHVGIEPLQVVVGHVHNRLVHERVHMDVLGRHQRHPIQPFDSCDFAGE